MGKGRGNLGGGQVREHLPSSGDRRSALRLLFILQATKAPVKCVFSLTLATSQGSSSRLGQLPVPGGSQDCANCLGPKKCQGPESHLGQLDWGRGGLSLGRGRQSGQRGASGLRISSGLNPACQACGSQALLVRGPE